MSTDPERDAEVKDEEKIEEVGTSETQKDVGNCPAFPDSDTEIEEELQNTPAPPAEGLNKKRVFLNN